MSEVKTHKKTKCAVVSLCDKLLIFHIRAPVQIKIQDVQTHENSCPVAAMSDVMIVSASVDLGSDKLAVIFHSTQSETGIMGHHDVISRDIL